MTKHTIELAGEFSYTRGTKDKSWEATATFDMGGLSTEIVAELARHGLRQKVADAASQATNAAEASAAMDKAIAALLAGDWSSRGTGEGVDALTAEMRSIARAMVKDAWGKESAKWKAFDALKPADANAKLDTVVADNEAVIKPMAEERLEAKRAAAEAKRKAKAAVSINI